jgi:integrase
MQTRFTLFRRGAVFYCEDRSSGQQKSLRTKNENEARKLVQARNDAASQPLLNLFLAKTYLAAVDPKLVLRTWDDALRRFCDRENPATRMRHERVARTRPMQYLKNKRLIETTADDILHAIGIGPKSTIIFLRTVHDDALGMNWLPAPILAPKLWPKMHKKKKRAITLAEHETLCGAVGDQEWGLYLQLLWHIGASQTDAANLTSANINWEHKVLSYERRKLAGRELELPAAQLGIGKALEELLRQMTREGQLFPRICMMDDRSRACFFWKLCRRVNIEGISLHSYRYAWAERAKIAGIPERWAQAALGHNSKAVHAAYARNAGVVCPPIDDAIQPSPILRIAPAT